MAAHVPHIYLPPPWDAPSVPLPGSKIDHLAKVLRRDRGSPLSYTDGLGLSGEGIFSGDGVERGDEAATPRRVDLVMASAPPRSKERQRFLVEKLAELGVRRLRWLTTRFGTGRPPAEARARDWAVSGLEQSRGAWLMETSASLVEWSDLEAPILVCERGGSKDPGVPRTVVVGPEGGWAPGEIPDNVTLWTLGDPVLRLETAAIVAAARLS